MKKRDSWDSEFRKKRFYDNQVKKALKKYNEQQESVFFPRVLSSTRVAVPKSIAIMLDLDGTSNWIENGTAEIFMKQVDTLREQFGGAKAYICISTHAHGSDPIKSVLDKLDPYANENIILANSFFYGGVYEYQTDTTYPMGGIFNMNKIKTFCEHYIKSEHLNIGWFALIDDTISETVFKTFQDEKPMVVMKPGCSSISKYNNFMYRETCTDNFYGVIELMDAYIKDIKGMDLWDVLDKQRDMIRHMSDSEIHDLISNREFYKLLQYLKSGETDKDDFKSTYGWLMVECDIEPFGKQYESYIEEILKVLSENGAFDETVEEAKSLIFDYEDM